MAAGVSVRVLGLVALVACVPATSAVVHQPTLSTSARMAPHSDLRELAGRLPVHSLRCVALRPAGLDARQRPLVAPVSQASELPWLLSLELSAYAAAEADAPAGARELIEFLRFESGSQEQIRHELTRSDRRMLRWGDGVSMLCGNEPGCVEVDARFLDPHTVQLRSRGSASLESSTDRSCASVLDEQPGALEVAVRGGSALGGTRRETVSTLTVEAHQQGVEGLALQRVLRHRFQDAAAAERAAMRIASGDEEAPTLGSSLVEAHTELRGEWLTQRARVSFEELLLAAEDQQRLRHAVALTEEVDLATPPSETDAEAVRRYYDALMRSPARLPANSSFAALDALLTRTRQAHPDDDGLTRRHYQLRLLYTHSPAGALEVAEQALGLGQGDRAAWQLARRHALLALDARRFRAALQESFTLSAQAAAQMADELERKVRVDGDYERAEWAFLMARKMCQRAERQGRVILPVAPRLPLAELPRLLAYLARLPPEREGDLGVHIVARGAGATASEGAVERATTWSEQTSACGGQGHVLAAASLDDAQLLAQGAVLAGLFPSGELELSIGVDPLGATGPAHGATVRLRGTVEQGVLVLNEVSKPLRDVRWPLVERLLLAPLSSLRGGLFPPDEWALELASAEQASAALAAVQTEPNALCERDGSLLRCRGSFSDARVVARALRRAVATVLQKEARALWSSAE